ncbi:MAG TPA: hypothetical protein HA254_07215 [Candidatus Diapherotrites archaeon]|uniref:Right-handed parallel beta-helix repeat-containing protein n=1 Tax=Candidatus Iainarchaeum sp. TaxID=3101447 RepID=A0A7J4J1Z1_9ARCH|nr:hypothetical protein [Candidatus Diapherotrites archaeon]
MGNCAAVKLCIAFAILLIIPGNALAANWYVDNAASGANDGTGWQDAWQSFADIIWLNKYQNPQAAGVVRPGDVIYISGGAESKAYNETLVINTANMDISNDRRIIVRAGQDENHNGKVIIDCAGTLGYGARGGSYVTLSGNYNGKRHIVIRNCTSPKYKDQNWAFFSGGSGLVLEYLEIYASNNGIWLNQGADNEVANSYIHGTLGDAGIRIFCPSTVGGCKVHDNTIIGNVEGSQEEGIIGGGPDGIQSFGGIDIYNNRIDWEFGPVVPSRNPAGQQHPDNIQLRKGYQRIYDNFLLNPANACISGDPYAGVLEHFRMYNNVCAVTNPYFYATKPYYVGRGMEWAAGELTRVFDVVISNNTFADLPIGRAIAIGWSGSPGISDFFVSNNLIYRMGRPGFPVINFAAANPDKISISNNLLYAGKHGSTLISAGGDIITQANGIYTEPVFRSYNGVSLSNDFRLAESDLSAKNNGTDLSPFFTADKDGILRPQGTGWDIGAYEYVQPAIQPPAPADTDNDGIPNSSDRCPKTALAARAYVNVFGCAMPVAAKFDIRPDFNATDINGMQGLELGISQYGKVSYTNTSLALVKVIAGEDERLNLDADFNITQSKISISQNNLPQLNLPATITIYNTNFNSPKILKDGAECTGCQIVSYDKNTKTIVFSVPGF